MSDFGTFLGKIAGKVVNAANGSQELMCLGKCDKITKHISISYADVFLSPDGQGKGEEMFSAIFGTVYDLFPVSGPLISGNPYACICCNKIRLHGGFLSHDWNKNSYLYLKKK